MGKLVAGYRQLGLDRLEVVGLKEEWLRLTDGDLTNGLVDPVLLEVRLNVEDGYLLRDGLLDQHDLRPEHGLLVLLGAVGVVIDAVVIGTLGLLMFPTAAPPEIVAQLALYELHGTDNF